MIHRGEIDGLRAVAVSIVVLCHAGVPFFSGGFVGVDVFFVISGFLITTQLIQQRERPIRALIIDFYARRARRILPCLAVVIFFTIAVASLWMPPLEQQDIGASARSAVMFMSNIYFWQDANSYFAPVSELQPLLHTWSLSVEEQFYIVWPIILLTFWYLERRRRGVNRLLTMIVVLTLTVSSFVLSSLFVWQNSHAVFFLTPFRFWELGAGALLALYLTDATPRLPSSFALVGLVAVLLATVAYSAETKFPGFAAALPVLGAVLVIAARPAGLTGWLLSLPPIRLTGKISYAWYLWHWPLLAFARMVNLGERDFLRDLLIVCLAYVPAYLSTRYLENPIRNRELSWFVTDRRSIVSGVVVVLFAYAAAVGVLTQGGTAYKAEVPESWNCIFSRTSEKERQAEPCVLSRGDSGSIFLLGDSQANHWSPVLADWARKHDKYAIDLSFAGCNVFASTYAVDPSKYAPDCREHGRHVSKVIEAAINAGNPVALVVSASWTDRGNISEPTRERDIDAALSALERSGARVLILGVTPTFQLSVPSCLAWRESHTCRLDRSRHDADRLQIDRMFARVLANRESMKYWDPTSAFCDRSWCYPYGEAGVFFSDKNHLTPAGALLARSQLEPLFEWLAGARHRALAKSPPVNPANSAE